MLELTFYSDTKQRNCCRREVSHTIPEFIMMQSGALLTSLLNVLFA